MSEVRGPVSVVRTRRRAFRSSVVLAVAAVTVTAVLSAGADARSTAIPSNTTPPSVTGVAVVDETLTAVAGSWTGTPPISFTLAWQRCDAGGGSCAAIGGATGQTYLVTAADIGSTLRVLETATNGEGSVGVQSAPTAVVTGLTAPVGTGDPVVSGATFEGSTLTTTTGTWTGTQLTFAYQWVRCDADGGLPDGSDCPSIPGATGSAYTLGAADIGHRMRVQVTATNGAGSATAASNPTAVVQQSTTTGPPRIVVEPSISGTLVQGRLLVASVGTWAGVTPLSYACQWMRCGADGGLPDASNCTAISGAQSSTYTLSSDDVGSRMRIRITASNSLGVQTVASNATDGVQASSTTTPSQAPANTRAPVIFGTTVRGQTLTASVGAWTGTAPLLFSYRWLRCPTTGGQPSGSDCTAITGATSTQYVLTADDVDHRLRLQVTARNTLGSATATSDATALVTATSTTTPPPPPTTLPPGAIRLPDGKYSIPVTSVSEPQRLVAQQIVFTPNPVRSRERQLLLRVRVLDTRGYVVRDALVFARSTPLVTSAAGEQRSARDGWASLRMTPRASFPLGGGRSVQFFVRVRKPTDDLLAGVSNRRLVQVATAG
jgi:hypothetical protein